MLDFLSNDWQDFQKLGSCKKIRETQYRVPSDKLSFLTMHIFPVEQSYLQQTLSFWYEQSSCFHRDRLL